MKMYVRLKNRLATDKRCSVNQRQLYQEHGLVLLWYLLLTMVLLWPLVKYFTVVIPGTWDAQDAIGMLWHTKEVALGRESLFFMSRLYAPVGITTLTHSIGPLMGFMVLPFWWWGATAAYNAAVLLGVWLTGCCMYWFARSLGLPISASVFAGTLFLMMPVHLAAIPAGHLGTIFLGLIPLTLLALNRALSPQYGRKWLPITALLFLLVLLHSGLQFIFTGLGAAVLALMRFFAAPSTEERIAVLQRIGFTALLSLAATGWLLLEIWRIPQAMGIDAAKSLESFRYQPDLIQFVLPGVRTSWLGKHFFADWLRPYTMIGSETAVYIPWTASLLSILACVVGQKTARQWFWFALCFILLAFGPTLRVLGQTEFTDYELPILMPYALLTSLPGLDFLRTPGRFMIMAHVGFALLAAFGLSWLSHKASKRGRIIIITGALAFLLLETWPGSNWFPLIQLRPVPDFYKQIAADQERYNVFDLPIRPNFQFTYDDSYIVYSSHYQMYQIVHGKGIASGYLARVYDPHPLFGHIITYNVFDYSPQDGIRVNHQPASRFTNMAYELTTHNYRYVVFHKPQTYYSNYQPGSWGERTAQQFVDEVFDQQPPLVDDKLVTVYEVPPTTTLQPNMALIDAQSWTTTPVYLHIASPTPQPALLEVQLNHIRDIDDQDLPGSHWLTLDMGNSSISSEIQAGVMITIPVFLEAGIQTMTMNWHTTQEDDFDEYIVSLDWLNLLTENLPYTSHSIDDGLLLVYGPGWYEPETWDDSGYNWYWGMSPASLWIYTSESRKIYLETAVGTVHDPAAANRLGHEAVFTVTINNDKSHTLVGTVGQSMTVAVEAQTGWNEVVFEIETGNFRPIDVVPESGDARELGFALRAFSVSFE
jgi:hypothetical protein